MGREVLLEGLRFGLEQVLLLGAVGDGVGLHNNFNIKDRRIIHHSSLEAVFPALQMHRCLQDLFGERVLQFDVAEEGVETLFDL